MGCAAPKPAADETEREFMGRCHSALADEYDDPSQRHAICLTAWDEAKKMSPQEKLLSSLLNRKRRLTEFGYGLTTADGYVKHVAECIGAGPVARIYQNLNFEALIKEASRKLVYANQDMLVESKAASLDDFRSILPDGTQVPPNVLMAMRHVVTSSREDRDKDMLHTDGAVLDPHAPLLWQHMHPCPIGRVLATVEHTKDVLRVVSVLLDLNDVTNDCAKLIDAGVLRFSHGFRVLEFTERKGDGDFSGGFDITKFEIMEVSLVSVPSNVDAEIELFSRGKLRSDAYKAHAKHFFDMRKRAFPGVSIASVKNMALTLREGGAARTYSGDNWPELLDAMPVKDLLEADVYFSQDKQGRVLSARNLAALREARDDLGEVCSMELPRAAQALCERCAAKLESVIQSADEAPKEDDMAGKQIRRIAKGAPVEDGDEDDLESELSVEVGDKAQEGDDDEFSGSDLSVAVGEKADDASESPGVSGPTGGKSRRQLERHAQIVIAHADMGLLRRMKGIIDRLVETDDLNRAASEIGD